MKVQEGLAMKKFKKVIEEKCKGVDSIFISSFVPRKCGIATYTRDLTRAIDLINPGCESKIVAMDKPEDNIDYPPRVKFKISQHDIGSYFRAADYINESQADIVILEHEFGLYGGEFGTYINKLVELIKKPLVITAHTVPDDPDTGFGLALKDVMRFADRVVVMMPESLSKLTGKYNYPPEKIEIIPHGVPNIPVEFDALYKRKKGLENSLILGNINLLSANKGLEYTIEALKEIKKHFPDVLYLIIGQTHPNVLQFEGEKYRNFLKEKIKKLDLKNNVRFINKYISLEELISWLRTIDIYITPYLDPQQSASGALAYAIGAGKVCISTPYLYAKEVLARGRGIIVPFRDPGAIATAVVDISQDPRKRLEIEDRAYKYGRLMTWHNVALQYIRSFGQILYDHKYKKQEFDQDRFIQSSMAGTYSTL
jgi:glycosyltransferase involved in cell wall biosynthesis